jgi:hypothetical protein
MGRACGVGSDQQTKEALATSGKLKVLRAHIQTNISHQHPPTRRGGAAGAGARDSQHGAARLLRVLAQPEGVLPAAVGRGLWSWWWGR